MIVAIHVKARLAEVRFNYDERMVELVRTVPGRRWVPDAKLWTIPETQVEGCAAAFTRAGATVTIDGKVWTPPAKPIGEKAPSSRVELLGRLFDSLPEHLATPTFKALLRVWHPDVGGDHTAAQDLNVSWSRRKRSA